MLYQWGGDSSELNLPEDSQKRLNKKISLLNTQCEEIKTAGLSKFVDYAKEHDIGLLTVLVNVLSQLISMKTGI